jgi:hypothetical protein
VQIYLRFKTANFIDVDVGVGQENVWRFTDLYGEPRWQDKHLTWQYLRDLYAVADMPWLVMGDLNEILHLFEKEGGNPRPQHFMQAFNEALDDCNLSDFGYLGHKFTWHHGRIREKLDQALTNDAWNLKFPNATLQNMEYCRSDHQPILMELDIDESQERIGPALLRFEAKWLKEAQFRQVVEEAWELAGPTIQNGSLAGKLTFVHNQLHKWDRTILKKSKRKSDKRRKILRGWRAVL